MSIYDLQMKFGSIYDLLMDVGSLYAFCRSIWGLSTFLREILVSNYDAQVKFVGAFTIYR